MLQSFPANAAPWYVVDLGLSSLTLCRYYSKPAFYVFVPVFELAVSCMYAGTRIDQLFYVKGKGEAGEGQAERGEKS